MDYGAVPIGPATVGTDSKSFRRDDPSCVRVKLSYIVWLKNQSERGHASWFANSADCYRDRTDRGSRGCVFFGGAECLCHSRDAGPPFARQTSDAAWVA